MKAEEDPKEHLGAELAALRLRVAELQAQMAERKLLQDQIDSLARFPGEETPMRC